MGTAFGVILIVMLLVMVFVTLVVVARTAGPFFAKYRYELEVDHLRIDVRVFGRLPLPGLKIPYANIERVARDLNSRRKFEPFRFSYASVWRIFNSVTITLKQRIFFNLIGLVIIAPADPDPFVRRLRAKL